MLHSQIGLQAPGNQTLLFGPDTVGFGQKMMWLGSKGAFRAGWAVASEWNPENIGQFSVAFGQSTEASGARSVSLGSFNRALGHASVAIGDNCKARGTTSVCIGKNGDTSHTYSISLGYRAEALADNAVAIGENIHSTETNAFALGRNLVSDGENSFAMGYLMNANGHDGAFMIGDTDPNGEGYTLGGINDQIVARFYNGYWFMTSGDNVRSGIFASHGANAWSSICDENQKENFVPLNDEEVLKKLASINYTSWNYKNQDSSKFRHYGIMAQDFYEHFGEDEFGTIGNDTTVNAIDMMGVAMSAIKGLKKRTDEMKSALETQNSKIEKLQSIVRKRDQELIDLKKQLDRISTLLHTDTTISDGTYD